MPEAAPISTATPRRRERRAPQTTARQLPFARAFNRYQPIAVLSADQIETIHRTALKLVRDTGIEVMQDKAGAILKAAGAAVDEDNHRVRFDPALVEESIATAPRTFQMQARNRAYDIGCGA